MILRICTSSLLNVINRIFDSIFLSSNSVKLFDSSILEQQNKKKLFGTSLMIR